jgi:hypothetical protein
MSHQYSVLQNTYELHETIGSGNDFCLINEPSNI